VAGSDLLAILDHLGLDRVDAVGQSMGGWSVVGAAFAAPGRFRRLVLADSLGGFSRDGGGGGGGAGRAAGAGVAAGGAGDTGGASDAGGAAGSGGTTGAGESSRNAGSPLETGGWLGVHPALDASFTTAQPELAHLYQSLGEMRSADTETLFGRLVAARHDLGDASRLAMPVLFVVGERDGLFPPETVRSVARAFADARVVEIPGCGHSPYFESPAEWNRSVMAFLKNSD
jgi:pimeloyl-ACP methyl ester carboxylesterase